jgi:hypothetical protein
VFSITSNELEQRLFSARANHVYTTIETTDMRAKEAVKGENKHQQVGW